VRIALFVTCLADTLFPGVGRATVRLLERLGHRVEFPQAQTCCGQMHINTGYVRDALPLVAGQLFDQLVRVRLQAQLRQGRAGRHRGPGRRPARGAEGDLDVLRRGQQRDQAVALQHEGHAAGGPGEPGEGHAVQANLAGCGPGQAREHRQQAGLA